MKGQILDVYMEGHDSFRACVLEVMGGDKEIVTVINLENGKKLQVFFHECEEPIIDNVFEL